MPNFEKTRRNITVTLISSLLAEKYAEENGMSEQAKKTWYYWLKTVEAVDNLMNALEDESDSAKSLMLEKLEGLLK